MIVLRQQMTNAVLVSGFSPRTHKSYLAAMSKIIVIEGLSATELVRFSPNSEEANAAGQVRSCYRLCENTESDASGEPTTDTAFAALLVVE